VIVIFQLSFKKLHYNILKRIRQHNIIYYSQFSHSEPFLQRGQLTFFWVVTLYSRCARGSFFLELTVGFALYDNNTDNKINIGRFNKHTHNHFLFFHLIMNLFKFWFFKYIFLRFSDFCTTEEYPVKPI